MQIQDTWVRIMAVDTYISLCTNVKNRTTYYHKNSDSKTYGDNAAVGHKSFERIYNCIKRK